MDNHPYYNQFQPYYNVNNGQPFVPSVPPEGYIPNVQHYQTLPSEHLIPQYPDFDDGMQSMVPAQGSGRMRRRPGAAGEHVKHRRTRSGCYTCRTRRVKCDETHPICERCRKGNRECQYPEPTTTSKGRSASKSKATRNENAPSDDEAEHDTTGGLPPIMDDDEEEADEEGEGEEDELSAETSGIPLPANASSTHRSQRELSETPSLTHDKSPTPSTEGSQSTSFSHAQLVSPRSQPKQTNKKTGTSDKWSGLPKDILFYLKYHKENLTHHHYRFKYDGTNFLGTTFLEIAIRNQPLLYAVVGFAAYHHTLTKPDGRLEGFLRYYNTSVRLLRHALKKSQRHTVAIMLTVLQLASIEESLGDWVNLLSHQKAAYNILTELWTPQTIMQNETLRKILQWYIRFDIFAGLLAGSGTVLPREWFDAVYQFYRQRALDRPDEIGYKYEARFAWYRLVGADVSILFAQKGKGTISDEDFVSQSAAINESIAAWGEMDPAMANPANFITDFSSAPPRDPDDIVDPYSPRLLYGGELWTTNFALLDYWAIELLFQIQLATAQRRLPSADVVHIALKICQMFEAIQYYPKHQAGSVIGAHAGFGIACLVLPKDGKYTMWCRRKLAAVESQGCMYPPTLRTRMTDAWGEDVTEWWLPNGEGQPPIIRSIREFIKERTMAPRDQTSEDLRDMKGLFSALSLEDEGSSPDYTGKGTEVAPSGFDQELEYEMVGMDEAHILGSPDYAWVDVEEQYGGH